MGETGALERDWGPVIWTGTQFVRITRCRVHYWLIWSSMRISCHRTKLVFGIALCHYHCKEERGYKGVKQIGPDTFHFFLSDTFISVLLSGLVLKEELYNLVNEALKSHCCCLSIVDSTSLGKLFAKQWYVCVHLDVRNNFLRQESLFYPLYR